MEEFLIELKNVDVMDEIVYDAITKYYTTLSKLGYYNYKDVYKLLLLCFYKDFIMSDYRGRISKE